MTNEQLIVSGDMSGLWDSLYRFTYQRAYSFYTQYTNGCINAGIVIDDLIQYAYIVMVKAVQLYKPDRFKFITYYGKVLFRSYQRLIRNNRYIDSLDKPIDSDDINSDTLIDVTADPSAEAEIDGIIETEYQRELQRDVKAVLDTLPAMERDVIHERFWERRTYDDIATGGGVDKETIRQTEHKALRNLRSGRRIAVLRKYRQDIIDEYGYRGSLEMWRNSHTSSTERTVIELEKQQRHLNGDL